MGAYAFRTRGLVERFGGTEALAGADLAARPGSVLGVGSPKAYMQYLFSGIPVMGAGPNGMLSSGLSIDIAMEKGVFDRFRGLPVSRLAPFSARSRPTWSGTRSLWRCCSRSLPSGVPGRNRRALRARRRTGDRFRLRPELGHRPPRRASAEPEHRPGVRLPRLPATAAGDEPGRPGGHAPGPAARLGGGRPGLPRKYPASGSSLGPSPVPRPVPHSLGVRPVSRSREEPPCRRPRPRTGAPGSGNSCSFSPLVTLT